MNRKIILLGLFGMLFAPAKWVLHATHEVAETISNRALSAELKLKKQKYTWTYHKNRKI